MFRRGAELACHRLCAANNLAVIPLPAPILGRSLIKGIVQDQSGFLLCRKRAAAEDDCC